MAFLRKRASGVYVLVFKWKGKQYIKFLGTNMTALQTSIATHNRRLVEFGNRVFDPAGRDRERT